MKNRVICAALLFGGILAGCGEPTWDGDQKIEDALDQMSPSSELDALAGFAGRFVAVDVRPASTALSDFDTETQRALRDRYLGAPIIFHRGIIEMADVTCDTWRIRPAEAVVLDPRETPNLVDLILGPSDSERSVGDQQKHEGFDIFCEDIFAFSLHQVDDRVFVLPSADGSAHIIFERPLSRLQIKAYQARLKSLQIYDGPLTGVLDNATLQASRSWYALRAQLPPSHPLPDRATITENLLDGLTLLQR